MTDINDTTVAQEILRQLGAQRFIVMTGSRNFISDGNSLLMRLRRNKSGAQFLKITLNSMDTYDLTFTKARGMNVTVVKELKGYYDDMLQAGFTEVTGLVTHL